jgi:cytochrome c-type biogenesis protein CcmH/NrfG
MSVGTELEKLKKLQEEGVLTEAEFQAAKSKLLNTLGPENTLGSGANQLGSAAKSWVNLQWVTSAVGFVAALLVLVFFIIPTWQDMRKSEKEFDEHFKATQKQIEQAHEDMSTSRKKFDEDFEKKSREMDEFRKKNFGN